MRKAKVLKNGTSQAVRLPKEFRIKGDCVSIRRVGDAVVLLPVEDSWNTLFESLETFTPDFLADGRNQPNQQ